MPARATLQDTAGCQLQHSRNVPYCCRTLSPSCSDDWTLQSCQWIMCPTKVDGSSPNCSRGADVVRCSIFHSYFCAVDLYSQQTCRCHAPGAQTMMATRTLWKLSMLGCRFAVCAAAANRVIEFLNVRPQAGIVPVFAVGNSGPDCDSVASPSDYPGSTVFDSDICFC